MVNSNLFLFIFVLFTLQFKFKLKNLSIPRCCAWDSNPATHDDIMFVGPFLSFFVCLCFLKTVIWGSETLPNSIIRVFQVLIRTFSSKTDWVKIKCLGIIRRTFVAITISYNIGIPTKSSADNIGISIWMSNHKNKHLDLLCNYQSYLALCSMFNPVKYNLGYTINFSIFAH